MDYSLVLFKAHATAEVAVAGLPDTGACGFAWVVIPGTDPLARYCRAKTKGGSTSRIYGSKGTTKGWQFWKPGGFDGQAVDAHEAGAAAFRDVLASYGISATLGSRLD